MEISCKHRTLIKSNEMTSYCGNCGVLVFKPKHVNAVKPSSYNYKIDLHPGLIYKNLNRSLNEPAPKCKNTNYLLKRQIILRNLQVVNKKLNFQESTFFLAVHYLDHIMLSIETQIKPELIGLCCIIISGKYNENDPIFPYVYDLQTIYPKQFFMEEEINQCEIFALRCLDYKLDHYTVDKYLHLFCINGIVFTDDYVNVSSKLSQQTRNKIDNVIVEKIYENCKFIINSLVEDEIYFRIPCIYMALSIIILARQICKLQFKFPVYFEICYDVKFSNFAGHFESIKKLYCKKTGIVIESEVNTPSSKLKEKTCISFRSELINKLSKAQTTMVSRDNSSSCNENCSTKQNSNISSDYKNTKSKEKNTNFLHKNFIKDGNEHSNKEFSDTILSKLRRPLNIVLAKKCIDLSKSKEKVKKEEIIQPKKEIKHHRNFKSTLDSSKFLNLTDLNVNKLESMLICPKNQKLNENKSFLIQDSSIDLMKTSSLKISEKSQLESLKSKLSKKIDFSRISTINSIQANNNLALTMSEMDKKNMRLSMKTSNYNIKTLLEFNSNRLNLSNLANYTKI